jgi:ketosteroid isomerase-like protein
MLEERRAVARRFVEGIAASKLPEELFAPDFTAWTGLSGEIPGTAFRQRAVMLGELFPQGLKFQIHETVAEGEHVALRATSEGTLRDGTVYTNDYHYLFRFSPDDRIRHAREYMNVKTVVDIIRPAMESLMREKAKK